MTPPDRIGMVFQELPAERSHDLLVFGPVQGRSYDVEVAWRRRRRGFLALGVRIPSKKMIVCRIILIQIIPF